QGRSSGVRTWKGEESQILVAHWVKHAGVSWVNNRINMNIITVINAKGGCGKSTIAMSLAAGLAKLGSRPLLIDMDPQAQVTQWLGAGDGLTAEGTLVAALE